MQLLALSPELRAFFDQEVCTVTSRALSMQSLMTIKIKASLIYQAGIGSVIRLFV